MSKRVLENEEELNVREGSKAGFKDNVQQIDGGAAKEQRARNTNCSRLPERRNSTRDVPDMHHSCTRDAPEMQRRCSRDAPECGSCTTCQMHVTMAAIVSLQNQLFRGSRSHGL